MTAGKIIDQSTKKTAKSERLSYEKNYYSSSQEATTTGTVPSACYLCRLKARNIK
jgi:hypothetical protein